MSNETKPSKPRTKPTTNRRWVVEDADGTKTYVRAVDVRVAKEADTNAILDGELKEYAGTLRKA